jgi:hypothetical protein
MMIVTTVRLIIIGVSKYYIGICSFIVIQIFSGVTHVGVNGLGGSSFLVMICLFIIYYLRTYLRWVILSMFIYSKITFYKI